MMLGSKTLEQTVQAREAFGRVRIKKPSYKFSAFGGLGLMDEALAHQSILAVSKHIFSQVLNGRISKGDRCKK